MRSRALASRLFHRWLISEDRSTLALFAHLAPWVQTEKDKRPVVAAVRSTAERIVDNRFPVFYSGIPTIQKEYTDQGLRDLWGFIVLSACMEEQMMGVFSYQIQVAAGEPEGALDPGFLTRVDQLESFVSGQPWVRKTVSIVDILKEMHQAMHGGDPAFYRVPESRELVAQYLLLYEASGNQEDIDALLTPDGSYVQIACQGVDMGTRNFFEFREELQRTGDYTASMHRTLRSSGRAIVLTTLIMISGFVVFLSRTLPACFCIPGYGMCHLYH